MEKVTGATVLIEPDEYPKKSDLPEQAKAVVDTLAAAAKPALTAASVASVEATSGAACVPLSAPVVKKGVDASVDSARIVAHQKIDESAEQSVEAGGVWNWLVSWVW